MRVLLINPPTSNLYAQFGADMPPLGLAYLAGILRKAGHGVRIVDLAVKPKGLKQIDLEKFDLVGISADTPRFPVAIDIAKEIKNQGKKVVMGGYHVTFMDEEPLKTGFVDYVVRGEGEEVLLNLVNKLAANNDIKEIPGISYKHGESIVRNRNAAPPHNLDSLPFPARDLLPLQQYHTTLGGMPAMNLITSRGCPFNCYFCASSRFGGLKWRARTPASIVDEIEHIKSNFGYRAFVFMDDNFTLDPQRVMNFADELDKRNLNIIWWCFSRADTIAENEPLVRRMAESGANTVFLGLESGSENILEDYNKKVKLAQERKAVALLRKYRINVYGAFILGAIHETKQMVSNTIRWAKELQPTIAQFSILTPYPGTALFQQAEVEKRLLHRRWELYDAVHSVMKIDCLKPGELQRLFIQAHEKFYLTFSRLLHPAKSIIEGKVSLKLVIKRIFSFLRLSYQLLKTPRC